MKRIVCLSLSLCVSLGWMIETGEDSKQNFSTDEFITKFYNFFHLGVTNLNFF